MSSVVASGMTDDEGAVSSSPLRLRLRVFDGFVEVVWRVDVEEEADMASGG